MQSRFLLQIIDRKTGETLQLEPGLAAEKQFVEDAANQVLEDLQPFTDLTSALTEEIVKRGVGFGRTSTHVAKDITDGAEEVLVKFSVTLRTKIKESIETAILDLKKQVKTEGR